MNALTRLYRRWFPAPELSCFAKGLIRALEEQGAQDAPYAGGSYADGYNLRFGEEVVTLQLCWGHVGAQLLVNANVIRLSRREDKALRRTRDAISQKRKAIHHAAYVSPVIAAIEKVGCP